VAPIGCAIHVSPRPPMTPRRSDAAERILREAMRLFADKGYERTSIADIQGAAGLHPGSGALYKHFPSKEAVLRAGIDRFVADIERGREVLRASSRDAGTTLEAVGRELLRLLGEERDALRIVWRELDQFPDLQARVGRQRIQYGYESAAAWMREQVAAGAFTTDDPEATAVVLMSSVTMYRVLEALFGEPPGKISTERFIRAWLSMAEHGVMTPKAHAGSRKRSSDSGTAIAKHTTSAKKKRPAHRARR
jgi:AcrR family transcriptional regulator